MNQKSRPRPLTRGESARIARVLLALLCVAFSTSCGTYDSTAFFPRREIHELRVRQDGETREAAEVDARIVGIMRSDDRGQRRVHARLAIENTGSGDLSLRSDACRLTPGSVVALAPENSVRTVTVGPGESRTVDLLFPLPDRDRLPEEALAEMELSWVLEVDGHPHESRATFQRGVHARRAHAWSYGPSWSYGYWYDPFCGPYWGPHVGLSYGHYHYRCR